MRHMKLLPTLLALLLLCGCSGGEGGNQQRTLEIRGGYLATPMIEATCDLTADYGQRVYDFSFHAVSAGEKTSLTLTAPAELQGMVVEIDGKTSSIQCDGVLVETGELSSDGLTPVNAIPTILDALQKGYIQSIASEDGILTLRCGDPDGEVGVGQEIVLTLDENSGDLLRGEILVNGAQKIDCKVTSITWGGFTT